MRDLDHAGHHEGHSPAIGFCDRRVRRKLLMDNQVHADWGALAKLHMPWVDIAHYPLPVARVTIARSIAVQKKMPTRTRL